MITKYKDFHHNTDCKCPICDEKYYLKVEYKDSDEQFIIDYQNDLLYSNSDDFCDQVWYACSYCGQPIFYPNKIDDDQDILYIYMSSFIGWEGCGENICLTINVVSCEANCIVSRDNKYEIFPIDETFTKKILKEKELILSYSSASDEDYIDDDNVYHFYSFYREKRNKYCLRHTYLKKHPLFNDLVTLIIKIHHKYKFKKLGS